MQLPKTRSIDKKNDIIVVRGAGDLATGTLIYLKKSGFKVLALETKQPTTIRRTVALSECIYEGECTVEGIKGKCVKDINDALPLLDSNDIIPVLVDERAESIKALKPTVVVDAIIAKRNCGTDICDAPLVIALGPGFIAGKDCHVVIETSRGHYLGRPIFEGSALPNTGIPGIIAGYGKERVVHSPTSGVFKGVKNIGDSVKSGEIIAYVDDTPVYSNIAGTLRGLLRSGLFVKEHFKVADTDPRDCKEYIHLVSDKARCIAGGVLLTILSEKF